MEILYKKILLKIYQINKLVISKLTLLANCQLNTNNQYIYRHHYYFISLLAAVEHQGVLNCINTSIEWITAIASSTC